jgi:acyl-CoA thioester hydrolase
VSDAEAVPFRFAHRVPVRFSDLDVLGHVNHIAFFDFLENGRIAYYFQVLGLTSVQQIRFVLVDLRIQYLAQAHYGMTVRILVRTTWLKRSSSGFVFAILDDLTGRPLAEGSGVQVYFDLQANRPEPLPEEYRERLVAFEGEALELRH